jgi:peroxiredoxin
MRTILLVICFFSFALAFSAEAFVYGRDQAYSGESFEFYTYSDPITQTPVFLGSLTVRGDGTFKGSIKIEETSYVYFEPDIYHLYFYAEPGGSYQLILPPKIEKTKAEKLNPFWQPEHIHIGIKGMRKLDLNYLILDFDYFFELYLEENMLDLIAKGNNSGVNDFIKDIDEAFPSDGNMYFESYKKYSYAMLRHIAYERKLSEVGFKYFKSDSVSYNNPAYTALFNKIYKNYLDNQLLEPIGQLVYRDIVYGHSIKALKKTLSFKIELRNEQLKEMVILKGLHDAFYNTNFAWTPLLLTLDSLCIITKYPKHKEIGQYIADKVLTMASGTLSPSFMLVDMDGDTINLRDFRNDFVYLNFIDTEAYTCQQELELLKVLHNKHSNYFKVVSIVTDDNMEKAKYYLKQKGYDWVFLFTGGDESIVKKYKVVAYPTYYLIGPMNELILSPAPTPLEGFERVFFSITR